MKLKDVVFFGFTKEMLNQVRLESGLDEEAECSLDMAQIISDIIGFDVIIVFQSGGTAAIIKVGD